MIFERAIIHWRNYAPWQDNAQVEQDLLLTILLHEIYSEPKLADRLAFRGGTCLNKLFWNKPTRYSEDLDFVQIQGEKIGPLVSALREKLDPLFPLKPNWEARRDGFRLYYRFQPEMEGGAPKQIKIEINTREHFSLEGYVRRPFKFESLWKSGESQITTFSIHELMATKVRALYQRRKGRDLFDLWKSRELNPDWKKIVPLFLEYMRRANTSVHRDQFWNNLQEKLRDSRFNADMATLLLPEENYQSAEAAQWVEEKIMPLIPESKRKTKKVKKVL